MRMVANIMNAYYRARQVGYEYDGLDWYQDAHALAVKLDPTDPARAAGVIAALSPMVDWDRNVGLAARAYRDGVATGSLGGSCRKATRILSGERPLDVLSGSKVTAFFRLIADPSDDEAVCVDRHAESVALAEYEGQRRAPSAKQYRIIAQAYRDAARQLSRALRRRITPAQVQAVTWAWFRAEVKTDRRGLIGHREAEHDTH